jgi:nitrile hydratase accessory protein
VSELPIEGPAAPPRRNGELVFDAPWQTRLFGMTMALHEAGAFEWEDFRQRLIAAIGDWDASHGEAEPYEYWTHWQTALEGVVDEIDLVSAAALDDRASAYAARPAGHDHDHDHAGHDDGGHGHRH